MSIRRAALFALFAGLVWSAGQSLTGEEPAALDQDRAKGNTVAPAEAEQPTLKIYPVAENLAPGLVSLLKTVLEQPDEVRIALHPNGRAIVVHAMPAQHRRIEAALIQLDKSARPSTTEAPTQHPAPAPAVAARTRPRPTTTAVTGRIELRHASAEHVGGVIADAFPPVPNRETIQVQVDAPANALTVTAPAEVFSDISRLALALDAPVDRSGNVTRVVTLRHTQPHNLRKILKTLVPAQAETP